MSAVDRVPGRYARPWCAVHNKPAGPDCPDRSKSPRQVRRSLKAQLNREIADAQEERSWHS